MQLVERSRRADRGRAIGLGANDTGLFEATLSDGCVTGYEAQGRGRG